jgi:hypothetical protein
VAGAVLWALLLNLHGFWFGRSQPTLMMLHGAGVIRCMRETGIASLWSVCDQIGAPAGLPLLTGLPQALLGWLVDHLPWVDSWAAHQVSNALVTGTGLLAGYLLLRRWSAPALVALVGSAAYLASPAVLAVNGQAYTFAGFVLLPAYLYVGLRAADLMLAGRRLLPALVLTVLSLVMAFTDGYTFLIGALLLAGVAVSAVLRHGTGVGTRVRVVATFVLALAAAGLAYLAYTPDEAGEIPVGIGAFRYLGLDVVTLVVPQSSTATGALVGAPSLVPTLWGDGTNVRGNYVGVLALALVAWLLVRRRRTAPHRLRGEIVPLVSVALVALVLSLGPALKVGSPEVEIAPVWDVPVSLTTSWLPTEWLFEHVPGVSTMRATYRWMIGAKLVVVALSWVAVAVAWERRSHLVGSRRTWATVGVTVLGLALLVDGLPNVRAVLDRTEASAAHVAALREGVVQEAADLVREDERFLILPSRNDFLANGLVPFTQGTAYNAGPDKNYTYARSRWPASVTAVVDGWSYSEPQGDLVCDVLTGDADAVLLPVLDPYTDVVSASRDPEREANYRWVAAVLAEDPRFVAERGEWLTVLRSSGLPC